MKAFDYDRLVAQVGGDIRLVMQPVGYALNPAIEDAPDADCIQCHRMCVEVDLKNLDDDDSIHEKVFLGTISGHWFLGGSALNSGVDIIDSADAMGVDQLAVAELVYCEGGLRDEDENFCHNALCIDEFYLKPEVRGTGLAQWVLRRFVEAHDPGSLCAILTVPKADHLIDRNEKKDDDPLAKISVTEGNKKLKRFLKDLGFKRVKKTKFYNLNFDPKWRYATEEE